MIEIRSNQDRTRFFAIDDEKYEIHDNVLTITAKVAGDVELCKEYFKIKYDISYMLDPFK